jgi:hypothetical protein
MTISNHTGVDEVTNLVNSEFIDAQINLAVQTGYIYEFVAPTMSIAGRNTADVAHPIRTRLSAAAAFADGAEFSHAAMATTQTTATAARYVRSVFVDERAQRLSLHNEYAVGLQLCIDACRLKIDTDVVGIGASATNDNSGTNATVYDFDQLNADITAFSVLAKSPSQADMVLHTSQVRDLRADLQSTNSALFGSMFGADLSDSLGKIAQARPVMEYGNVLIWQTDRVPAADTTGKGGFIVERGEGLAVVDAAGFMAGLKEADTALGNHIYCAVDYAVLIKDQNRIMEVISRA